EALDVAPRTSDLGADRSHAASDTAAAGAAPQELPKSERDHIEPTDQSRSCCVVRISGIAAASLGVLKSLLVAVPPFLQPAPVKAFGVGLRSGWMLIRVKPPDGLDGALWR